MTCYEVAKTIYLNNGQDEYLKYEILNDSNGVVDFVMAYMEVRIEIGPTSVPVWTKVDDLSLDHLIPPKTSGFQTEVRVNRYPGKSISTAIDVCKQHRKNFVRPNL